MQLNSNRVRDEVNKPFPFPFYAILFLLILPINGTSLPCRETHFPVPLTGIG